MSPRKSVPLNASVPVVKSSVPAKSMSGYAAFDDFARTAEHLNSRLDAAFKLDFSDDDKPVRERIDMAERLVGEFRDLLPAIAEFELTWATFEPDDLYEPCPRRADLLGTYATAVIRRDVVANALTMMVAGINQKPQNPKLYARLLIEETLAAMPRWCALEAASREIRRSMTFLPSAAELLKVLRRQMERWRQYSEIDVDIFRSYISDAEQTIPWLRSEREKQEAEEQRQQERARERKAKAGSRA
jgi:hypothetical protein